MKIQIDIDSELWGRFRSKVINDEGKTLAEVVPGVVEPAIRAYLEPPLKVMEMTPERKQALVEALSQNMPVISPMTEELPIYDRITPTKHQPGLGTLSQGMTVVRRCELCDSPTERLFSLEGKRVCYGCWKAAITAIAVPTPPAPPEAA